MKTIRRILVAVAFVTSVGGAIGSNILADQNTVYRYYNLGGPEDDLCDPIHLRCGTNYQHPCQVNTASPVLRNSANVLIQCGQELTRETPPQPFFINP